MTHAVRPPAVAGTFYPSAPNVLAQDIAQLMASVALSHMPFKQAEFPKAIIVPHAGYIYSGPTAAIAYASLAAGREHITRVVLLGPVHRIPVRGLALPGVDDFATPLGQVAIDQAAVSLLQSMPQVVTYADSHALEHSLEVQLPFLQTVLARFKLIPLVVGDATASEVAEVLEVLWGGPETLIVVSSDLSHFLSYDSAQVIDNQTVQRILTLAGPITHEQACGATPINGMLLAAQRHHLHPVLLDVRNSGDTAGNKGRVVGYASFAFVVDADTEIEVGLVLLSIARAAIAESFGVESSAVNELSPWLQQAGACFVTLTQYGQLRGCIGSLAPYRPLLLDVKANAQAAAFHDPRFPPLTLAELPHTVVEVSLLSPMQMMYFTSEQDALAQLRPSVDGIVFEYGAHRSTFLPQVWEQLPKPADFMAHLKLKAGLAAGFWESQVKLYRYTVNKWQEPAVELPVP